MEGNIPSSSLDYLLDALGGVSSFGLGLMGFSTTVQNTNKSQEFKRQRCTKIMVVDFDGMQASLMDIWEEKY
jgi:hypothetical protein